MSDCYEPSKRDDFGNKFNRQIMKVFNFKTEDHWYMFAGEDYNDAEGNFLITIGDIPLKEVKEISEEDWDDKNIKDYDNNKPICQPDLVSIRELLDKKIFFIATDDHTAL